ncbi:hypothetical protein EJ08DRAFT_38066 [Tothia fuscella]|uniref:Uncharacterized protein n=1 Tax=Tothia fuscella TaxID=1048955 RepID=A0A9P4NY10_9PEZI|nr:hypothetical protein EJ08DRAFT_38066 [Tothia fuscella]
MKRRPALQHAPSFPCRNQCHKKRYKSSSTSSKSIPESPTPSTQDGDTRTFRSRQAGYKALPLPPLIDPVRISQRKRYKETKAPPPKHADFTPFQKKLYNNPFARALADPTRFAHTTTTRLPSSFLIRLDAKTDPKRPDRKWLLPIQLFSEASPKAPTTPSHGGLTTWLPARKSLIKYYGGKDWHRNIGKIYDKVNMGRDVFRSDMDDLILGLLRDVVVKRLRWCFVHPKAKGVGECEGGADKTEGIDDVGCILYVLSHTSQEVKDAERELDALVTKVERIRANEEKRQKTRPKSIAEDTVKVPVQGFVTVDPPKINPKLSHPPLRFPTVRYRGHLMPVYSLHDLLGEEKTRELLKETVFENSRCLALMGGNLTAGAQMALLKLQGYVL